MENDPNVCYTCPTSKERNGVTAGSFQKHIQDTHPLVSDDNDPPDHTLMILILKREVLRRREQKEPKYPEQSMIPL
jgi:hypothetical protein